MQEPRISVIIPAYNAAETIEAALGSVEAQTVRPHEVIVVDDGSSDGTAELVAARHPEAKLVRQANQGCGMARNTGVRVSSGNWLAFLDADDLWLPEKLERQVQETGDPEVAVIACRATTDPGPPTARLLGFDDLWPHNHLVVSSSLVRRSALEAASGFWSERACEDYHLWLRLTATGWKVVNCPERLVVYAPTVASLSRQIEKFAAAELACVRDVAARFGLPASQLRDRLASCYLKHGRGAIHMRNMQLGRRFVLASLRHGISAEQLSMLMIACAPSALLDFRRWVMGERRSATP